MGPKTQNQTMNRNTTSTQSTSMYGQNQGGWAGGASAGGMFGGASMGGASPGGWAFGGAAAGGGNFGGTATSKPQNKSSWMNPQMPTNSTWSGNSVVTPAFGSGTSTSWNKAGGTIGQAGYGQAGYGGQGQQPLFGKAGNVGSQTTSLYKPGMGYGTSYQAKPNVPVTSVSYPTSSMIVNGCQVNHILFQEKFKIFTLEQVRFYDYVYKGAIFNPLSTMGGGQFNYGGAGNLGGFKSPTVQVYPQDKSPWEAPVDIPTIPPPPPTEQKQPYGELPPSEISIFSNELDDFIYPEHHIIPKPIGFSHTILIQEKSDQLHISKVPKTPGFINLAEDGSLSHKSERSTTISETSVRSETSTSQIDSYNEDGNNDSEYLYPGKIDIY